MKKPDMEISNNVLNKLNEANSWNKTIVNKLAAWIIDGTATTEDLIFMIENQRPESAVVEK